MSTSSDDLIEITLTLTRKQWYALAYSANAWQDEIDEWQAIYDSLIPELDPYGITPTTPC